MRSIFEYRDYKSYFSDAIGSKPNQGRGERSKVAALLGCHLAYISQVLNGQAQLSLEQADNLNGYFDHTPAEADFFLLLVSMARAGTKSLTQHYKKKIDEILSQREMLKNRLEYQQKIPEHLQPVYYSAWYYTAIHFLISIPEFQHRSVLADYLNLSPTLVSEVLDFLVSTGLAVQKGGRYLIGPTRLHLGSDSPMISKHHTNWRLQALHSLETPSPSDLHYSSIVTFSRRDLPKIRTVLIEAIEKIRALIVPSKDEICYCYALDLFQVGSPQSSTRDRRHDVPQQNVPTLN